MHLCACMSDHANAQRVCTSVCVSGFMYTLKRCPFGKIAHTLLSLELNLLTTNVYDYFIFYVTYMHQIVLFRLIKL